MNSFSDTLASISQQVLAWIEKAGSNWRDALLVIAALWVIHFINFCCGYRLNRWGVTPRTARGLVGIFISPFVHGDSGHLFFNSVPLFVILSALLVHGWYAVAIISGCLAVMSGGMLWLFGARGTHIGASGVIMGYIGYMLASAYFYPSTTNLLVAGIMLLYFGGSLLSIFPWGQSKRVSWQGHLFGLLSGVALVMLFRF